MDNLFVAEDGLFVKGVGFVGIVNGGIGLSERVVGLIESGV